MPLWNAFLFSVNLSLSQCLFACCLNIKLWIKFIIPITAYVFKYITSMCCACWDSIFSFNINKNKNMQNRHVEFCGKHNPSNWLYWLISTAVKSVQFTILLFEWPSKLRSKPHPTATFPFKKKRRKTKRKRKKKGTKSDYYRCAPTHNIASNGKPIHFSNMVTLKCKKRMSIYHVRFLILKKNRDIVDI